MVVRILMLPGFSQNAVSFETKWSEVQELCGDLVELVFVDPPHVLSPLDMEGFSTSSLDSTSSFETSTPHLVPRAWWYVDKKRADCFKADAALRTLRDFLCTQTVPFDGVLGFSQGASSAAMLTAMCEHPNHHPDFLVNGKPPHPPFKFGVFVAGFRPLDPNVLPVFDLGPLKTVSLHVIGQRDTVINDQWSQPLVDSFTSSRVEQHKGGHSIPLKPSWQHFFKSYFTSFDVSSQVSWKDIPSPDNGITNDSSSLARGSKL